MPAMAIADGAFYYPTRQAHDDPTNYDLSYEDIWIGNADGILLHGWFFPAAPAGSAVGTLVHCHGNAGNITAHFKFTAWLAKCGWNVLCFDYRGYGRSMGKANRRGTVTDAHAALRYATHRDDVDASRVCVLGQSLGGAVAIVALAQDHHGVVGMCIDGAFASYRAEARDVARRTWYLAGASRLVSRYMISEDLSPIDFVADLPPIPKLFICGAEDHIVDYRQTVALHDLASQPKQLWVIPESGHTEALTGDVPNGRERFVAFLNSCVE